MNLSSETKERISQMQLSPELRQKCQAASQRLDDVSRSFYDRIIEQQENQEEMDRVLQECADRQAEANSIKLDGAKASIELLGKIKQQNELLLQQRDEALAQEELLSKQLMAQTTINTRLEAEFNQGAQEAVKMRNLAILAIGIAIVSLLSGIIIAIVK